MEGLYAPAARACHADNLPILPVEIPRTFGTLTTRYVSRRAPALRDGEYALSAAESQMRWVICGPLATAWGPSADLSRDPTGMP